MKLLLSIENFGYNTNPFENSLVNSKNRKNKVVYWEEGD